MSEQGKLSAIQWLKGLAIFAVPTIITVIQPMVSGEAVIDLGAVVRVAMGSALTYLFISLTQDSKGVPLGGADKK